MSGVNTDLLTASKCFEKHKIDNPDSPLTLSQIRRAIDEGSLPILKVGYGNQARRLVHYETFNEWLKGDKQVASENKLLGTITVGGMIKILSEFDENKKLYIEGANPKHRRGISNVSEDYPGVMIQFWRRYDEEPYFKGICED